jgi:hypothetical protein
MEFNHTMKRLVLALILIVPTFGAATLPDATLEFNPWPNCLPCPRPTEPAPSDGDQQQQLANEEFVVSVPVR